MKIAAFVLMTAAGFPLLAGATDMEATRKLHADMCVACHEKKSAFGDADAIYRRADSTVKSYQRLKTMVSLCNSELRLGLFPDDEQDLVNYLNASYYKFKP